MMKQLLLKHMKRITEKASAGKKPSDWEIGILMHAHPGESYFQRSEISVISIATISPFLLK
jgi:hypothetical protein